MPDPFEYLKAVLAAIVASTTIFLALRVSPWKRGRVMFATANVCAMTCGILAGYITLNFSWPWPPANALDRFVTIVLPAILIVELIAAIADDCLPTDSTAGTADGRRKGHRTVRGLLWLARFTLACGIGRILMHGSIYLHAANAETRDTWLIQNLPSILLASSLVLTAIWFALTHLAARVASSSIVLSLSLSILCAGGTTMMAGYIKGGAAALPLATVLIVSALASQFLVSQRFSGKELNDFRATETPVIGIGLVSLFGLLWIGRFFGQLTSADALVMFFAPTLCWITELPPLRHKSAAVKSIICLAAVMIPLAILLANAKREFDEKMGPLL